jgi:hypothetical protein
MRDPGGLSTLQKQKIIISRFGIVMIGYNGMSTYDTETRLTSGSCRLLPPVISLEDMESPNSFSTGSVKDFNTR